MEDSRSSRGTNDIQVGDLVRVRRPQRRHKVATRLGPVCRVRERLGKHSFVLDDGTRWHTSRLIRVEAQDVEDEGGVFDKYTCEFPRKEPVDDGPEPRRSTRIRREPVRYPQPELPGV